MPQLTYPESLYFLDNSLQGYKHLYDKAGPFQVNSEMMGLNMEGQPRVWFNDNFAENHPSREKGILQSTVQDRNYLKNLDNDVRVVSEDEASLVRNIVEVVEDKTQEGVFPDESFKQRIYG